MALLHKSLLRHGFSVGALHGDMDQSARTAALDQFRKGEIPLLVASDVAARGLDIPAVSHVFNFDVPHHADDYVHRIGRTGRAGRIGTAITLVAPLDNKSMAAIEKLIGQTIPRAEGSPDPVTEVRRKPRQLDTGATSLPRRRKRTVERRVKGGLARRFPRRPQAAPRTRTQRSGPDGGRDSKPAAAGPAAAFTPPAAPPPSRTPSIGRTQARQAPRESASEPADHSHLPAFLLRPVRVRV